MLESFFRTSKFLESMRKSFDLFMFKMVLVGHIQPIQVQGRLETYGYCVKIAEPYQLACLNSLALIC